MSPLDFLSHPRRRSPPLAGSFFVPPDLSGLALMQALSSLAADVAASSPSSPGPLQRRNARALVRKAGILLSLLEFLGESIAAPSSFAHWFPDSATLCLRELYIVIYRAKILLDYCSHSSRLWLVLRCDDVSGGFRDLDQELTTVLDVLPLGHLGLSADVREQLDLLRRQCRGANLYVDPREVELRRQVFCLLDEFGSGEAPDPDKMRSFLVDQLGIEDGDSCRTEIELLEEKIFNQEAEEADLPLLGGVIALARYCRFSLFAGRGLPASSSEESKKRNKRLATLSGDSSFTAPKDFSCPISLDLMRDPVVVSTGQTYDRASIIQWMEEGHYTCPNSGQVLDNNRLIPNRAICSLISQWCAAYGIPFNSPDHADGSAESIALACTSKAAISANRTTAKILVQQLSDGTADEQSIAAHELRLLAKIGKQNRSFIAELGTIPLLFRLLTSSNSVAQENAVTALLNLSIHEANKKLIMDEPECLRQIADVLIHGETTEARENAAATLFSLSVIHEYKKMIVSEPGAVEALAALLKKGTPRGKRDAVMALFNLSTHPENWAGILESGAVTALAGALANEALAEEAAGALALLMKQSAVAYVVGSSDSAIKNLVGLLRRGSPKCKENAVAALHEMCRRGGMALTQMVARMPALGGLVQNLILTGTKRARRKATSLARLCQRCESSSVIALPDGFSTDHTLVGPATLTRVPSFGSMDMTTTVAGPISVPVP